MIIFLGIEETPTISSLTSRTEEVKTGAVQTIEVERFLNISVSIQVIKSKKKTEMTTWATVMRCLHSCDCFITTLAETVLSYECLS